MGWSFGKKTPEISDAFASLHKHLVWMQDILPELLNTIGSEEFVSLDELKEALIERTKKENISTALVPVLIEEILRRLESGQIKGRRIEDKSTKKDEDEKTNSQKSDDSQGTREDSLPNPEPSPQPEPSPKKDKKRKGGRKAGQRNLIPADFKKAVTVLVGLEAEVRPGGFCPCCHEKALEATKGAVRWI